MFKRTTLALAIAALTFTGVMYAQENATLIMKSGERMAGELMDLGGVGFTIKVNGQERQIPANEVAVIDFTGNAVTDAELARVAEGKQVVVLKDGQTFNGQLYDISGSRPLKITFKTETGDREISSAEIGRIVLAKPATAVATTGSQIATATGPGIIVPGNRQWTATGITVRKGDRLNLTINGEIQLSSDANDIATANGAKSARNPAAGAPLPNTLAGALIGRIGNGAPFGIGNTSFIVAPQDGQLFLGINDDHVDDNRGEFRVEITNSRRR